LKNRNVNVTGLFWICLITKKIKSYDINIPRQSVRSPKGAWIMERIKTYHPFLSFSCCASLASLHPYWIVCCAGPNLTGAYL